MTPPPIEQLVGAVMQSYGQLALILDHMSAWSSPDAEPVPEVLRALLIEVLTRSGAPPTRRRSRPRPRCSPPRRRRSARSSTSCLGR
jgi:hypothetical protein